MKNKHMTVRDGQHNPIKLLNSYGYTCLYGASSQPLMVPPIGGIYGGLNELNLETVIWFKRNWI